MLLFKAPLHTLRKTKIFKFLLSSRFNSPNFYDIGFDQKVALRPVTHASILWQRNKLEKGIRKLINLISTELAKETSTKYFFDIGANIGLYTWQIAMSCPTLKTISFEPDPNNFELLKMTLEKSNLDNVELCPYALSNQSCKAIFHQDQITSATGSLSSEDTPWIEQYLNGSAKKITVQKETLDSIVGENKIPSLIKIDVEGHEYEVLEGGIRTIRKYKPLMIIESFAPKQTKVIETLKSLGYQIWDADRLSTTQDNTNNLFAWHPNGPLKKKSLKNIIHK